MSSRLTGRELSVLTRLAQGNTAAGIAEQDGVRGDYVRQVCASARVKLGASTNEQAVAVAVATGLITVATPQAARARKARELALELARLLEPV